MTEVQWLACSDPQALVQASFAPLSVRKRWLLGFACCQRIVRLLRNRRVLHAVSVVEKLADGSAVEDERIAARIVVQLAYDGASKPTHQRATAVVYFALGGTTPELVRALRLTAKLGGGDAHLAELVRHLAGNPFQPPADITPSRDVLSLTEALEGGVDNHLFLADALEESGHSALGRHFRRERRHPKGCWAVDRILGRN